MKVRWLVNENFPAPSVAIMRASGHDVLSNAESHSGDDDIEALALARKEGRRLVTFDQDYGELLFARHYAPPPAVILLRVPSYRHEEPAGWCVRVYEYARARPDELCRRGVKNRGAKSHAAAWLLCPVERPV